MRETFKMMIYYHMGFSETVDQIRRDFLVFIGQEMHRVKQDKCLNICNPVVKSSDVELHDLKIHRYTQEFESIVSSSC